MGNMTTFEARIQIIIDVKKRCLSCRRNNCRHYRCRSTINFKASSLILKLISYQHVYITRSESGPICLSTEHYRNYLHTSFVKVQLIDLAPQGNKRQIGNGLKFPFSYQVPTNLQSSFLGTESRGAFGNYHGNFALINLLRAQFVPIKAEDWTDKMKGISKIERQSIQSFEAQFTNRN